LEGKILKERILLELNRSGEALKEAQVLLKAGLGIGAISRAYYSILHAVRAVLLTVDIEPESHHGAFTMFGLHFIKSKLIEEHFNDTYKRAMDAREQGDYTVTGKLSVEDAGKILAEAEGFIGRMKEFLKSKGLA